MNKLNTTTRCYPRTLEEAFPDNVESLKRLQQGEWMEHHQKSYEPLLNVLYAFCAGFFVSMVIFIK